MQSNSTPQPDNKITFASIKKYLIIATIVLVCSCAFLAILMIFFGTNWTLLKVLSTLLIMYLVLMYSSNNLVRVEDSLALVRGLSVAALIANFFWSILWILLVWGAFGEAGTDLQDTVWRIIGTAAVISVFCTYLSSRVVRIVGQPTIIKFFKSLPLVCAAFLGLDLLLLIWIENMDDEFTEKLILVEIILIALQAIITSILKRNAHRLGIKGINTEQSTQEDSQNAPTGTVSENNTPSQSEVKEIETTTSEAELRAKIEQEVRAKIAAEQAAQQNTDSEKTL